MDYTSMNQTQSREPITFMSAMGGNQTPVDDATMNNIAVKSLQTDYNKAKADLEANLAEESQLQSEIDKLQSEIAGLEKTLKDAETDYMYNQRKQITNARKQDVNALTRAYRQDVFNMDGSLGRAIERIGTQDVADAERMANAETASLKDRLQGDMQIANQLYAKGESLMGDINNAESYINYMPIEKQKAERARINSLKNQYNNIATKLNAVNGVIKSNAAFAGSILQMLEPIKADGNVDSEDVAGNFNYNEAIREIFNAGDTSKMNRSQLERLLSSVTSKRIPDEFLQNSEAIMAFDKYKENLTKEIDEQIKGIENKNKADFDEAVREQKYGELDLDKRKLIDNAQRIKGNQLRKDSILKNLSPNTPLYHSINNMKIEDFGGSMPLVIETFHKASSRKPAPKANPNNPYYK